MPAGLFKEGSKRKEAPRLWCDKETSGNIGNLDPMQGVQHGEGPTCSLPFLARNLPKRIRFYGPDENVNFTRRYLPRFFRGGFG